MVESGSGSNLSSTVFSGDAKEIPKIKEDSIGEYILKRMKQSGSNISQVLVNGTSEVETSYEEMVDKSIRAAVWLKKEGVKQGDVIGVCVPPGLNEYVGLLAPFLVRATYNPWHHLIDANTAGHMIRTVKPKIIITTDSSEQTILKACQGEGQKVKVVSIDTTERKDRATSNMWHEMLKMDKERLEGFKCEKIENERGTAAMILFTSGTTGNYPKAISYSYEKIAKIIVNIATSSYPYSTMLWYNSLAWMSGTFSLLACCTANKKRYIDSITFEPVRACSLIARYKIGYFFVPSKDMISIHNSEAKIVLDTTGMCLLSYGGSKLSKFFTEEIKKKLPENVILFHIYGMSEAGSLLAYPTQAKKVINSVGFAAPNVQLKIVAEKGKTIGEILFKSPMAMDHYVNDDKATKEMIDEEGWYRTGDVGYFEKSGELCVVERLKDIIHFKNSVNVYPSKIEDVLLQHPDVAEAAVLGKSHPKFHQVPIAFVVISDKSKVKDENDGSALMENIKNFANDKLDDAEKLRGGVRLSEQLLYTYSAKLNKLKLQSLL